MKLRDKNYGRCTVAPNQNSQKKKEVGNTGNIDTFIQ